MRSSLLLAVPALLVAGCSREEEPVANQFERQKAEIEAKAQALESQVENEVSAVEAQLQNEVDVLMQNQPAAAPETNAGAEGNSTR